MKNNKNKLLLNYYKGAMVLEIEYLIFFDFLYFYLL